MNAQEQKVLAAVDRLADQIVDFTARLTAEPSTLGNEQSAVLAMEEELVRIGLAPVRIPIDPARLEQHPGFAPVTWEYKTGDGRYNLAAVREAAGPGGGSCLFNGHLDVVSHKPLDYWETDPFEPVIRDGWMHGRGAGDMKAGVAAMTYALHAVEQAGFGLRGDVTVETVLEEECCGNGALACLDAGYDADAVLIPEPFGPAILTDQVGVMWFKVSLQGRPSHVLAAGAGANAIEKCFPLIQALKQLEAEMNEEPRPERYAGLQHPLNLNVGIIEGGDWPSTVPAFASFHGRLSFFPGEPYDKARQRVADAIAAAAWEDPWLRDNAPRVEFYGFRSEGHSLDRSLPMVGELAGCQRDLAGAGPDWYVAACTTDLRAFTSFGRGQATCFGPVAENIHAANERVHIESIIHTARVYALFLCRWCCLVE